MQNENENEKIEQVEESPATQIIMDLKENSVSKKKYDELYAQTKELYKILGSADPEKLAREQQQENNVSEEYAQELRRKLYGAEDCKLNNLEYWQTSLELRRVNMELGYPDDYIPQGRQINPTPEDVRDAQNLADGIQYCIEQSQGDSERFTAELQRITRDTNMYTRR